MEEQILKRNTDCLYFLASPLTCKKGDECEYRHSDIARLNPRDCWYWLNGNCRNPNCAFRHPPLEGLNGAKTDSFYATSFSAASTNKLNVPCYFFFNAICTKGEQCTYSHDNFPAQKASKSVHELAVSHPEENKASKVDFGFTLGELLVNPPVENLASTNTNDQFKEAPQQITPDCELEEFGSSAESGIPECEEPANGLIPSPDFMDQNGQLSPYQSSQGFDVLVDDGSENLAYEDADYPLPHNRESDLLRSKLSKYEIDGSVSYDHVDFSNTSYLYDELYENYDHMDESYAADYLHRSSELPREERISDHHQKHKLLHMVHARDEAMNARERYHRRIDACWLPMNSQKRRRSHALSRLQEMPLKCENLSVIQSRLTPQIGRCMIYSSQDEGEPAYKNHSRHRRSHLGNSRLPRSRLRERRRRQNGMRMSSEHRQGSAPDARESAKSYCNIFAGPKTLAQIKQEKNMDLRDSKDFLPRFRKQQGIVDFEGPKPLEELLKVKRSSGINIWCHETTVGRQERLFENGYPGYGDGGDDDDDDDDPFRRNLASIVSN